MGGWVRRQGAEESLNRRERSSTKKVAPKKGFTEEERAAMKERARELKEEARANKSRAEGESDVLAKIAEMPEPDRAWPSGSMRS